MTSSGHMLAVRPRVPTATSGSSTAGQFARSRRR